MIKPRVYLAGPVQHADDNGIGWRDRISERDGYEWVNPLDAYDSTVEDVRRTWEPEEIVAKDESLIDSCSALLVNWTDVKMCGTPMEIQYAHERDKHTIVRTPLSEVAQPLWLRARSDAIVPTFENAVRALSRAFYSEHDPGPIGGDSTL